MIFVDPDSYLSAKAASDRIILILNWNLIYHLFLRLF